MGQPARLSHQVGVGRSVAEMLVPVSVPHVPTDLHRHPTLWSRPVANNSAEFGIAAAVVGDRDSSRRAAGTRTV